MKRIFCIAFIFIVCSFSFLTGYCSLYSVPVYGAQDQWEDVTSNEQLADAFRAYCKSRNTVIDGSVLDAVTSFTTTTFNNLCNTLGIDVTLLQAELHRSYTGSGYKYAFSQLGLSTYNRIFAEFLQNNDLSVGDSVEDKVLKSGRWFQDDDGNGCWCYITNYQTFGFFDWNNISVVGSTYIYNGSTLYSLLPSSGSEFSFDIHINSSTYTLRATRAQNNNVYLYGTLGSDVIYNPDSWTGDMVVCYYSYLDKLSVSVRHYVRGSGANFRVIPIIDITSSGSSVDTSVNLNTFNNTVINNETVINEGDTYIINQDGEPETDDPVPDDPGSDWNPVLPDVPDAGSDPSGGNTIDWPDLDLPDFDLPNFSLGDLRLKFPFSIPFDIVSILGVINAPAVAPVIQEDIPIRIDLMNVDYTIPINLDMSDSLYDNFAVLVRAVEFIGFCIGLIHLTIRLVKG